MQFQIPYEHRTASGIYAITNLVNGKVYVGSAVNFFNRYKGHRNSLLINKHPNFKVQKAVTKYGIQSFAFVSLEVCQRSELIHKEQMWIDQLGATKTGYNISLKAYSCAGYKHTVDARQKISESQFKPVNQYDKNGTLIYTHSSIQEAAIKASISVSGIIRVCKAKSPIYTAGGYIWRYPVDHNSVVAIPPKGKIFQFTTKGDYIQKHESLTSASMSTGVHVTDICFCLQGKLKIAGGFVWSYNKEVKPIIYNEECGDGQWYDLPQFEGFYKINAGGVVMSVNKIVVYSDGHKQTKKGKVITPTNGRVMLYKDKAKFHVNVRKTLLRMNLIAEPPRKPLYNEKQILQCSKDGSVLKHWKNISLAGRETGITNISACLRGLRSHAGGFIWQHADATQKRTFAA